VSRYEVVAEEADVGRRIDAVLAAHLEAFSRSRVQELIKEGAVLDPSGQPVKGSVKVAEVGESWVVEVPEVQPWFLAPSDRPLDILYADADVVVVVKPAGLVVHPGAGQEIDSLAARLLYWARNQGGGLSNIGGVDRPGIVHRLDLDTSGVMVVALNDPAHRKLSRQFSNHTIERRYLTVLHGEVPVMRKVDAPIGRHALDRMRMTVREDGRPALTTFYCKEQWSTAALVEAVLGSGRTHQIRVHARYIRHPVVGDSVYGFAPRIPANADEAQRDLIQHFPRQALHAQTLGFDHPVSGERLTFTAPPPDDMALLIEVFRACG